MKGVIDGFRRRVDVLWLVLLLLFTGCASVCTTGGWHDARITARTPMCEQRRPIELFLDARLAGKDGRHHITSATKASVFGIVPTCWIPSTDWQLRIIFDDSRRDYKGYQLVKVRPWNSAMSYWTFAE